MTSALLPAIIVCAIAAFILRLFRDWRLRRMKTRRFFLFASQHRGVVLRPSTASNPTPELRLTFSSLSLEIFEKKAGGEQPRPVTLIRLHLGALNSTALRILITTIKEPRFHPGVRTDPSFVIEGDNRPVYCFSDDRAGLENLLSAGLGQLLSHDGFSGGFTVRLDRHVLSVTLDRHLETVEEVRAFYTRSCALFEPILFFFGHPAHRLPAGDDASIGIIASGGPPDGSDAPGNTTVGECPVCGFTLEGDIVRCAWCGTPHHRECWIYFGRCSVYGCDSFRTLDD